MPPKGKEKVGGDDVVGGEKAKSVFKSVQTQLLQERWIDILLGHLGWAQVAWDKLEGTGDCWAIATLANSIPKNKLAHLDEKTRAKFIHPVRRDVVRVLDGDVLDLAAAKEFVGPVTAMAKKEYKKWGPDHKEPGMMKGRYWGPGNTVALLVAAKHARRHVLHLNGARYRGEGTCGLLHALRSLMLTFMCGVLCVCGVCCVSCTVAHYAAFIDETSLDPKVAFPKTSKGGHLTTSAIGRFGRMIFPFESTKVHTTEEQSIRDAIEQELLDITLTRSKWVIIHHDGRNHYTAWLPTETCPPETGCA